MPDEESEALEGENLRTTHWEDAHHWLSTYADLLEFKRNMLDRITLDMAKLSPVAQKAVLVDVALITNQMGGYEKRLALWSRRLQDLHGLWLDTATRTIRYKDREATLTPREFQLVHFLLDHPGRYFTVDQILKEAWAEAALFPEEVRNYVQRVRKVLVALEVPSVLVNRPSRGYRLEFRIANGDDQRRGQ
jgi:DNA-binding winged helix-turn-helix (wHTH) protein